MTNFNETSTLLLRMTSTYTTHRTLPLYTTIQGLPENENNSKKKKLLEMLIKLMHIIVFALAHRFRKCF